MNPYINYQLAAAIMGGFCVIFGAFGAHALKAQFGQYEIGIWNTATQYVFVHTLLVLFASLLPLSKKITFVLKAGLIGNLLFGGSLYILALTGNKMLGAVTPIGGVCYLAAWFTLAWHLFRQATFTPGRNKD